MPFDPEGSGYDFETAIKYSLGPDETDHWPSRVPQTGQLLKGRKHPTFYKTERGEKEAGFEIYQGEDGKWYSRKNNKNQHNGNLRKDGTEKGPGFLGVLQRPDGKVSTELSTSSSDLVDKDGKEILFPLLVPTLTDKEVEFLLSSDPEGEVPDEIFFKAIDHARERIRLGQSPFIEEAEIMTGDLDKISKEINNAY